MTDDLEKLWEQAEDVAELWLSNAEALFPDQLSARELEALEYLRSRNGDPNSDCSEWAGAKDENHHTGIDVAQFLRAKLIFEFMRRLATREFMAVGKLMRPDGLEAIREIPAAAFSGFNTSSQRFAEPNRALEAFSRGLMTAFNIQYYDVRIIKETNVEAVVETRKQSGRPRKRDALKEACRIALKQDPKFCSLQTQQAFPLVENILKTTLKNKMGFEGGFSVETLRRAKNAVCGKTPSSK